MREIKDLTLILLIFSIPFFSVDCHREEFKGTKCRDAEPAWSPDGRTIAYYHDPTDVRGPDMPGIEKSSSLSGMAMNDSLEQKGIWLLDLDTGERKFLTDGRSPAWSPDGEEIVFVREGDIYKIRLSDGNITQLTTWGSCFFPDWSPDGKRIAYDCTIGTVDSNGIWIVEIDTKTKAHLGLGRDPNWSPDGNKIAYEGAGIPAEYAIWVANADGTEANQLTHETAPGSGSQNPDWSPDGKKIVFDSERDGLNIWVMDTDGKNQKQLTNDGCSYQPSWSPDSKKIVYVYWSDKDKAACLWIMNADGTGKEQITFPDN